jgi:hypothetical protein
VQHELILSSLWQHNSSIYSCMHVADGQDNYREARQKAIPVALFADTTQRQWPRIRIYVSEFCVMLPRGCVLDYVYIA